MAKKMAPILPILSILGYWSIILGSFGGPGGLQVTSRPFCRFVSNGHNTGSRSTCRLYLFLVGSSIRDLKAFRHDKF